MKKTDKAQNEHLRRCMVCRCRKEKGGLLRFTRSEVGMVFDFRAKMSARGIYVCASKSCLEVAWRKGIAQSESMLEDGCATCREYVVRVLLRLLRKRYAEWLLNGFRARTLIFRTEEIEEAAKNGTLAAYMLATDASDSTRKKYTTNAARKSLPVYGLLTKEEMGGYLGKEPRSLLGWLKGECLDRLAEIETMIGEIQKDFEV